MNLKVIFRVFMIVVQIIAITTAYEMLIKDGYTNMTRVAVVITPLVFWFLSLCSRMYTHNKEVVRFQRVSRHEKLEETVATVW